jgi:hypothetical protein
MAYQRLTDEQKMQNRIDRRENRDYAAHQKQTALAEQAEALIGKLVREGKVIYYINVRRRDGSFTGKTAEFALHSAAVDYLIRNHYV